MELAQLAVFVRPPVAGQVKTRLVEVLGERGAAALYQAFVEDTLRLCDRARTAGQVDIALWSSGPEHPVVSTWARRLGTRVRIQPNGDLGTKLSAAFDEGLRDFERVAIIGSDAPTLPLGLIADAFDSLQNDAIALGPANDGGYYVIAARQARPRFNGVRWSTATAMQDTVAANPKRVVALLSPWYDIDEPEDLAVLNAHLSVDPTAAPSTFRALAALRAGHR